jgi:NAD(P)H-dependent flavin oxidoreductase YrpB (nitropropane dioxygenase family)
MAKSLRELCGADFPLFAFSHCRDVVAAVSRAGGFGVLGCSTFTPEQLDEELRWIGEHVDGKPFGVDIIIPENIPAASRRTIDELAAAIPPEQIGFVRDLLARHDVTLPADEAIDRSLAPLILPDIGQELLEVAFRHPIRFVANALGLAPPRMIELGRRHGVAVGALCGAADHAVRQVEAGVDIVIAQGSEAGGHTGEVSTLVLVPEVVRAVEKAGPVPVLAAGGIMNGRQMAGCMAMAAAGVWTGSVWLATPESGLSPVLQQKIVEAGSRDTVRSKARTGKYSRQLRSDWHRAWDAPDAPDTLPMPLMGMVVEAAFGRITREAERGHDGARALASYFMGQGIGLVDQIASATSIVQQFKEEFADAVGSLLPHLAGEEVQNR